MPKRQSGNKKNKQSNFAKLSIFQPNKYKFKKNRFRHNRHTVDHKIYVGSKRRKR